MFKDKGLILWVVILFVTMLYGCSSTGGVSGSGKPDGLLQDDSGKAQAGAKGPNFLKSIEIEDYMVKVVAEKPFEYSLTPPSDPFKIVVSLKAVDLGMYRNRIVSGKEGIAEVSLQPSGADGVLNVEITLTSPFETTHKQSDNVLTVGVRKDADGVRAADVSSGAQNGGKEWLAVKSEKGPIVKSSDETTPIENLPTEKPADKSLESHPVSAGDTPVHEARSITGVSFKRERDAVNVIIRGDGALKPVISSLSDVSVSDKIAIDIPNVKIASKLPKEIAVPLKALRWEEGNLGVRVVLELQKDTPYEVLTVNDTIIVSLTTFDRIDAAVRRAVKGGDSTPAERRERAGSTKADVAGKKKDPVMAADMPAFKVDQPVGKMPPVTPVQRGDSLASPFDDGTVKIIKDEAAEPLEITMCGKRLECGTQNKIRLNVQDAPVTALLKLLADESGCDIVVDSDVSGKVTMQIKDAPWYQVVDLVQKILRLGCDVTGNIIRIANQKTLDDMRKTELEAKKREDDERLRISASKRKEEEALQELAKVKRMDCLLKYVPADEVNKKLLSKFEAEGKSTAGKPKQQEDVEAFNIGLQQKRAQGGLLTAKGTVYADESVNKLIVIDIESALKNIRDFIHALDVPKKQVLIETKIIEVNNNISDALGINWGFFSRSFDKTGAIGIGKGAGVTGQTFLADMPTTVSNLGSGIALGFINAQRTLGLDLKLQAMETSNSGKIITSPRLLTMNNEEASITQGLDIPYPIMNPQGVVSAAFKSVSVDIKITPKITPGRLINLDVEIKKEDLVGYTKIGGSDAPNTTKLNEKTKVIVKDGETLVLGGIFKQNAAISEEGTAGLKDIPVLGWLFKSTTKENKESEYLIFITPRVVEREFGSDATDCKIVEQ
ncbi:MAG: type IV pilus secretin PilQ [Nitrospirae bacterium]|uniref:type IV pilus secretin PilQ n=1 Tax=Candidatus Magnetobacterium casense TaxID=1455061 RepID=UPI00058F4EBE|nr:type IV pilus secretin PilQ [Candidatus Magnetobacterium casensis]MBF0337123.1 type IV pilus secretin PilQ [Nitrospirota bacterium]